MDLLTGFTTILAVIGAGAFLAHRGVIDERAQRTLAEVSFFVATPALMLTTISRLEIGRDTTANVVASAVSLTTCFLVFALVSRLVWRNEGGDVLIGALVSSYVNAGNLGIAVGAYVVGDAAVVVPTLLVQVLVVQPLSLAYLDRRAGRGTDAGAVVKRLASNPLTIGSAVGLVLAVSGWTLPTIVGQPVALLAGLAIPAMLLSYGAALRLSPPLGRAGQRREVVLATVLKLGVMPVVAWAVGSACGLDGRALLGVVIVAGLPTAQNIFLHSTRYRVGETLAREVVLVTTLGCLPVALLIALLLG